MEEGVEGFGGSGIDGDVESDGLAGAGGVDAMGACTEVLEELQGESDPVKVKVAW